MRARSVVAAAGILFSATIAMAQTDRPLTPLESALGCAQPAEFENGGTALRVLGGQDTVPKTLFGKNDLLVVGGGTASGVQLGQTYFIRRPLFTNVAHQTQHGVETLGWLRIVAANDTTAIGSIEQFCDAVQSGDYLEPFNMPAPPPAADANAAPGELDFSTLGHVLGGKENHLLSAPGDFVLIDRGTDQGVAAGDRFAIYRDLRSGSVPLSSVAEAVVVVPGKTTALARVTRSRDAIVAGDYVVPRK